MDLAGYVVKAVRVEGQRVNDVCAAHGISRSWLYELIGRYRAHGEAGLRPRSEIDRLWRLVRVAMLFTLASIVAWVFLFAKGS